MVGLYADDRLQMGKGLLGRLENIEVEFGEVEVGLGVVRLGGYRPTVGGFGLGIFSIRFQQGPQVVVRLGEGRLEPYRLAVVGLSLLRQALAIL